ncbi:nucleoside triphosphate pyrophosphohydrolase [Synechococcus elongatus]|uniref:MazG family protein n=1 Tax=Synechococcus elongatus (strain ATCC 33912 / PCC 7942 / FACHB-805) TaxID=1140 RepID=Q31N46_SYNE7|nr:nucleoside triphosphate pyrophosphohydrolase [Synechococcus elongatus]ABB57523.1 MazG family protein [Synechococcus elongatus PCC 7942 = FACHB-805]AJD57871.1 nucleoside triphosphate hydrolase [Synechococcus elongatus UTEX 2973]MBD2588326.1 nucleoside triphosphate pyrophosphohydrolase [Synechococcus elongatus FACHB-242]MBD2689511.1 nucleoside triphosphate pyrophosphohydrolase [Synechococcus elongatus FACHB-1061]MBD2708070.1 nucleoside triphosphate pyrophosphohydrolase [Synechococcus elongatu
MGVDFSESVPAPNQDAIATALLQLVAVVAQLRDPEQGCPWDREQTPTSLIPYVLEEAYEVVHALRQGNPNAIAEELGDLLLQVVLQAQIASESQQFDLATVADGITEKLIRRHPHVFGEAIAETPEAVQATWQAIKAREKGEVAETLTHCLSRYAATLPPLTAALKISQRAAKAGFEWPNLAGVWDKFEEELAELKEALDSGDRDHAEAELGDLLFSLVNIARWCQLDPVAALQGTNDRFVARFQKVEAAAGQSLDSLGIETLEKLWQQAKRELGQSSV